MAYAAPPQKKMWPKKGSIYNQTVFLIALFMGVGGTSPCPPPYMGGGARPNMGGTTFMGGEDDPTWGQATHWCPTLNSTPHPPPKHVNPNVIRPVYFHDLKVFPVLLVINCHQEPKSLSLVLRRVQYFSVRYDMSRNVEFRRTCSQGVRGGRAGLFLSRSLHTASGTVIVIRLYLW